MFERDSFLTMRSFLNKTELEDIRKQLSGFIQNSINDLPPEHVFHENKSSNCAAPTRGN
tara:strand:+ start:551 stop:727 length:177 start_codon:yes stop_codon:yes gene_type:complete